VPPIRYVCCAAEDPFPDVLIGYLFRYRRALFVIVLPQTPVPPFVPLEVRCDLANWRVSGVWGPCQVPIVRECFPCSPNLFLFRKAVMGFPPYHRVSPPVERPFISFFAFAFEVPPLDPVAFYPAYFFPGGFFFFLPFTATSVSPL